MQSGHRVCLRYIQSSLIIVRSCLANGFAIDTGATHEVLGDSCQSELGVTVTQRMPFDPYRSGFPATGLANRFDTR